jgi:hypothetical protein
MAYKMSPWSHQLYKNAFCQDWRMTSIIIFITWFLVLMDWVRLAAPLRHSSWPIMTDGCGVPRAVQTLHRLLWDCVECMGVGANMPRSDHIAEEGGAAVPVASGNAVGKDLGDVRWAAALQRAVS